MKRLVLAVLILLVCLNTTLVYGENINTSAESQILIDSDSGRVLYEKNPHKKMPMASTTKIMTAIIALERGNLDDEVEIKKDWVGVEGSSIYLRENETISLKDMLYGLMLRSGNDVSVAIACHIAGSVEEFSNLMNEKARAIGAMNTNFKNPHGLHHEDHYTTAYDLALITKEAFTYPEFAEIVKSKSYTSARQENNYFYNKNKTLWEYEGGDGVKTGYTMKAGRCLVSSASRNNMRLIAVSLNGRDWFNDNYKLLDYGFENFKPYFIYTKGQFMKKVRVEDGVKDYANLVTGQSFIYPLKENEEKMIKVNIDVPETIKAPIEKDVNLGYIYTYLGDKMINKDILVPKSSINKLTFLENILRKMGLK